MKKKEKQNNSLRRRFSIVGFAAVTLCIAFFSVIQFYLMDDIFALAAKVSMIDAATEISETDFESPDFLPVISDFETSRGIYIEVYDNSGKLIYTTEGNDYVYDPAENPQTNLKSRNMKVISHSQRKDGSYFELREEVFATAQYIVYGASLKEDSSLQIFYPVDTITKNAETASITLFALSVFALMLYYIATYYLGVAFSKPVYIINSAAKKIADLDFTQSCPRFRITELDELSKSINTLSNSLENALNDLKSENLKLESDILKERALEKSRRDFVANASHELKTPISIIQGYAEGMKYGIGCDSTDEFCDIIIDEAEKMNSLVVKLLEFLHIGSGEYPVAIQSFYLDELLISHLDSLENIFREKGITLKSEIASNLHALGDPTLLRIVFNNYISNAISHSDAEKTILVTVKEEESVYNVTVFNSGEHISDQDIGNIWQSFYRADKSHSRAEGRFGLGLSIVSTIQDVHGEKYGVKNVEGGVEFNFTVRKAQH
ncbi:MAG: HAMP domain-containing histidine kinase [Ruminococcaceae bacterium]|nr:HAMP domain-containing histidine kinase [Oscillospiraceae bacterium]